MSDILSYFKIIEVKKIKGNDITFIDCRTDKEKRYNGIGTQWQGHAVQDYLKEKYMLESGYIMSCTDYSDSYGKDISDTVQEITLECSKRIKQYVAGDLNKRMPKLVTIGNYGWTMHA